MRSWKRNQRERSRRAGSFWIFSGSLSLGALWCVRYAFLPDVLRLGLGILGGLGFLLFLVFLSAKSFGRDFYIPMWWWFP